MSHPASSAVAFLLVASSRASAPRFNGVLQRAGLRTVLLVSSAHVVLVDSEAVQGPVEDGSRELDGEGWG